MTPAGFQSASLPSSAATDTSALWFGRAVVELSPEEDAQVPGIELQRELRRSPVVLRPWSVSAG
jgi:hypothetical protein